MGHLTSFQEVQKLLIRQLNNPNALSQLPCGAPGSVLMSPRWLPSHPVSHTLVMISKRAKAGRAICSKSPSQSRCPLATQTRAGHMPAPSQSLSTKLAQSGSDQSHFSPWGWAHLPRKFSTLNKTMRSQAGDQGKSL